MSAEEHVFAELTGDFIAECLPLAEAAAEGFVALERAWRQGEHGTELSRRLTGLVHTVKGNSAMMGLGPIQHLAHAIEDLHGALVHTPGRRNRDVVALLVESSGVLVQTVRAAARRPLPGAAAEDVASRVRLAMNGMENGKDAPAEHHGAVPASAADAVEATAETIKVDFRRLDGLLELLGESIVAQSALRETRRRLVARFGLSEEVSDLDGAIGLLEKSTKALERGLMATRVVPIGTVFGRFTRLVRDIGHRSGKSVRLEATGGDTLLDKTIVDRLGEPLVHLLMNAVAHGVEVPAERRKAGKPEEAVIRLEAIAVGDCVRLRVLDDGRGLDRARIMDRARSLGLDLASLQPSDIHQVIFAPGFSTVSEVSEVAGRGVGLDVVARGIHALSGSITVESEPGQGTMFELVLPLTLAVLRALVVDVAGESYAIPLTHVGETIRLDDGEVHQLHHQGMVLWRGSMLAVDDAAALFNAPTPAPAARHYCVVLTAGTRRRGLLVSRLIGHQEIVIKGLDPMLGAPPFVSGTTILGDGRVACILDAVRLTEHRSASAA